MDGQLRARLIHNSDADARLPAHLIDDARGAAAVIYPFRHQPPQDAGLAQAVRLYESSLHYYVLGLRWAGSPYAMHTVGSTIAVDAFAYAGVRGFPRRSGAEDFYLLNKLAKTGVVHCPVEPAIVLETRASTRVPFGTGPAVRRIATLKQPLQDFTLYGPRCFAFVRDWIGTFESLWSEKEERRIDTLRAHLGKDHDPVVVDDWIGEFDVGASGNSTVICRT